METPIYQFLLQTQQSGAARFYMPGHKGQALFGQEIPAGFDITEIKGADALFSADGIIGESERNAARLFQARETLYSTQGSTLCIQTMVYLAAQRGKKIIAGRNAHLSFIHACTLMQVDVQWLLPEHGDAYGICGNLSAGQVGRALEECPDAAAVYITSPDYLGNTAEVEQIAQACHAHNVLLICDNAHGAYLPWGAVSRHPLALGADLCCDSAHKTLPVLTGGAYLHLSGQCPWDREEVKYRMGMLASTSPSYLILCSLDLCNRYLAEQGKTDFIELEQHMRALRQEISALGFPCLPNDTDFAKLTIDAAASGSTGTDLAEYLRGHQIECEYANHSYTVMMMSPVNQQADYIRLLSALKNFRTGAAQIPATVPYALPEKAIPAYEADRMPWETVPLAECAGRISARTIAACPPGVPVITAGERFDGRIKNICENSGNSYVKVLK